MPADEWFWLSGDECGSSALILTEASGCLLRAAVCPAQLNSPRCDVPWPPNPLASNADPYARDARTNGRCRHRQPTTPRRARAEPSGWASDCLRFRRRQPASGSPTQSKPTLRPPVARKHKRSRRPHHPHPAPRGTRPRWRGRADAPVPAAARAGVQLLAMTIAGSCEAPPSWWRCHRAGRRLSLRSVGFCPERQSKSGCGCRTG